MQTLRQLQTTAYNTKWDQLDTGLQTYDRITRIIDGVGDGPVDQMLIDKTVNWISKTWPNPATARRVGNDFKAMVSMSQRYHLIPDSLRVDLPEVVTPRRQPIDRDTMDELDSMYAHRVSELVYLVLRDCGLRGLGTEIRGLIWSDFVGGILFVTSKKGGKHVTREVPVPETLHRMLERERGGNRDTIFTDDELAHFGMVWSTKVQPVFGDIVPYQLRHSYATRLLQRGVPLHVVQSVMGHSDIKTTMTYAHIQQSDLDKVRAAV